MHDLCYELLNLCKHNRDGSHASQAKRRDDLRLFAHQLTRELHFPRMHARSLKEKHVKALVSHWQTQGLSGNTLKARMSRLRWWAEKVNKPNLISPHNRDYGIGERRHVSHTSKACDIDVAKAKTITDCHVVASLLLARAFGLRKEEAIKFIPKEADQGDAIHLKASWCKGGKARVVPVLTQEQREALDFARSVAGSGSLIPADKRYHQQQNRYEKLSNEAGFKKLHGLRHRYAQWRYQMLTGWPSPHAGGPSRRNLTAKQQLMDKKARLIISRELGHERLQISATYLGT